MNAKISNELCMSVKNKTDLLTQCPHKKKFGDFCGIHHNRQTIRIDQVLTSSNGPTTHSVSLPSSCVGPTASTTASLPSTLLRSVGATPSSTAKAVRLRPASTKPVNLLKTHTCTKSTTTNVPLKKLGPTRFIKPIKIKDCNGLDITLYHKKDLYKLKQHDEDEIDWNRVFYTCLYYRIDLKGDPVDFLAALIDFLENDIIFLVQEPRELVRSESLSTAKGSETTFEGPGLLKFRGFPNFYPMDSVDKIADFLPSVKNANCCANESMDKNKSEINAELELMKQCANTTDFHEMIDLEEIPRIFRFYFKEDNPPVSYCCDIRSLYNYLSRVDKKKNPYTNLPLSPESLSNYKQRIFLLERNHISLEIEQDEVSSDKKHELEVLDVFQIIYSFGYAVDHNWYLELDVLKKKKFYYCLEDLWNFRLDLTKDQKAKVVPHKIFTPKEKDSINSMKLPDLDSLLLQRIREFVTLGKSKDEKVSGAMYVLMALIQVSEPALEALPQLGYAIVHR
jgi:hypothetical protein